MGVLSKMWSGLKTLAKERAEMAPYRVLSVEKNDVGEYVAMVQVVNKSAVVPMKPEEILADDRLTDSFSQRDVRTLTYLGYLGINSPKYKILAKRLLEQDNKIQFAVAEKGKKRVVLKTAEEISADEAMISGLDQKDAHVVGYTSATEQVLDEQKQKQQLIQQAQKGKPLPGKS